MRNRSHIGLFIVLAVALAGCDKMDLTAPTESTIAVTAANVVLPNGGSTQITATVLESAGTPVQNGTTVRFSTTLGRLDPPQAQTRNGYATTMFFAGDESGVATVRGVSGDAIAPDNRSSTVEITIGGAAAESILLTASPARVPPDGGTVTIIATVLDEHGNRLKNLPVSFSTTAGTLSTTVANTDANGEARVELTTTREATVTARAGGQSATVTVGLNIPSTVTLAVATTTPTAGVPVAVTVTPTISAGSPPPMVTINWGDGTSEDIGIVPAPVTAVHTYQNPGSYIISATARSEGQSFTTSTVVTVAP